MLHIVSCRVFKAPYFLHFKPSLDASRLPSVVISSMKILSLFPGDATREAIDEVEKAPD